MAIEVPAPNYPARLDGRLEGELNRWLWIVKIILIIPHVIVLILLFVVDFLLTIVAGFSILFTGRYPRSIFDFNLGVMRWAWRVGFYSFGAFATDRYPPFTLARQPDYPADFDVDYPEEGLSRWKVIFKWWLFAIPQLLILAILDGGFGAGFGGASRLPGLISILALVAAVIVAVKRVYPRPLFDLLMGLNRWSFRVMTYVGLMRDEYPPFRLDMGDADPGSRPVIPPTGI